MASLRRAMRPAPAEGAHGGWRAPSRHASRSRRRRTHRWMARSAAPCVPLPPQAHTQVDGALRRAMRPAPAAGAHSGGWRAPSRHASRSRRRRTTGGWRAPPRHASRSRRRRTLRWMARSAAPCVPLPPQAHDQVDGALRRAMRPAPAAGAQLVMARSAAPRVPLPRACGFAPNVSALNP